MDTNYKTNIMVLVMDMTNMMLVEVHKVMVIVMKLVIDIN